MTLKRYLPGLIILLGILIRLRVYLDNRSLWVDEAHLAVNLINRSYLELLHPLSKTQNAPIAYLWSTRFLIDIFGKSEYVLRLLPLLAGVLSLFLFYKLSLKLLNRPASIFAIAMFAFAGSLIYYSSEAKQYSAEVLCAVVVYLVVMSGVDKKPTFARIILVTLIGVLSVLFSFSSILILAGIGCLLCVSIVLEKKMKERALLIIPAIAWALSVGTYYLIFVLPVYKKADFLVQFQYFSFGYIRDTGTTLAIFWSFFASIFESPWSIWFAIVLFFIGLIVMSIKKRIESLLLISPVLIGLIVSMFHKYPLEPRLFLFAVPIFILYISQGLGGVYEFARKHISKRILLSGMAVILLTLFSGQGILAYHYLVSPPKIEEIKQPLQYYIQNKRPGDVLYVYYGAESAYLYYSELYGLSKRQIIIGHESRENWDAYLVPIDCLKGERRVWFLFSHVYSNEEGFIIVHLDRIGKRLDYLHGYGASIYLYNLKV